MDVFLNDQDHHAYLWLLDREARRYDLTIWAYCLMPNHVHVIAVPATRYGLARPFGRAHQQYARRTNRREGWRGHLWQQRFYSCPMDEIHAHHAIRYVLLNPVRAGLVERAEDWPYSSARAHLFGIEDRVIDPSPVASRIDDWVEYLRVPLAPEDDLIRRCSRTGRPLGSDRFIEGLERQTGRQLKPCAPGRRRKH